MAVSFAGRLRRRRMAKQRPARPMRTIAAEPTPMPAIAPVLSLDEAGADWDSSETTGGRVGFGDDVEVSDEDGAEVEMDVVKVVEDEEVAASLAAAGLVMLKYADWASTFDCPGPESMRSSMKKILGVAISTPVSKYHS